MSSEKAYIAILIISLVTILLRCIPFIIFHGKGTTPRLVAYLGRVLPSAIIGMLVVYCLKDVSFTSVPDCLPAVIACGATVICQVWKRNSLISIILGTALYIFFNSVIFP